MLAEVAVGVTFTLDTEFMTFAEYEYVPEENVDGVKEIAEAPFFKIKFESVFVVAAADLVIDIV